MYEKLKEYWLYIVLWVIAIWLLWIYFIQIINEKKWNEFYETFQVSILNQIPRWDKKDTIFEEIKKKNIISKFWKYNIDLNDWIYVLNWINLEKWLIDWKLSYKSEKWLLSDLYNNEETKKDILEKNNLRLYLLPWESVKHFSKEYNSKNWWFIIKWDKIILWNWTEVKLREWNDFEKWYINWSHFWIWFFKNNEEAKEFKEKYFPTIWYVFWWEKTPIVVVWLESQWNVITKNKENNSWWDEIVEIEDKEYFCILQNEIKDEHNFKYILENSWNQISTYSRWWESDYTKIWKHIIDHWYLKRKFEFDCILDWKIKQENKEIIERFCEEWYTYNWNDNQPKCIANINKLKVKTNLENWILISNWTKNLQFNNEYNIQFDETTNLIWTIKNWFVFINSKYTWLNNEKIISSEQNWLNLQFKNPNNNVEIEYKILKQCKTKQEIEKWSIIFDLWNSVIFDSRQNVLKTKEYSIQHWKVIWNFDFKCSDDWIMNYTENYTENCQTWYEFNWNYNNPICVPKKHTIKLWTNIHDSTLEINWERITWNSFSKEIQYTNNVSTKVEFDENIYYLKNKNIEWINCNEKTCSFAMPNNNVTLTYEVWKFCIIPNEITKNWISFDMWEHKWKKLKDTEKIEFSTEKTVQNWKIKVKILSMCNIDWTLTNEIQENWETNWWCNTWYEYHNFKCIWKHWWWTNFHWTVHRWSNISNYSYTNWEYRTWETITFGEPIKKWWYQMELYTKVLWTYILWSFVWPHWFTISERSWKIHISWIVPNNWVLFADTYFYKNCEEGRLQNQLPNTADKFKIDANNNWVIEIWTTVDKKIEKRIRHWKMEWYVWVKCSNFRYEHEYEWPTKLYSHSVVYSNYDWEFNISHIIDSRNWKNKKIICDKWYRQEWEQCVEIKKKIKINVNWWIKLSSISRCSWIWYWEVKVNSNYATVVLNWSHWDSNTVDCTFVVKPDRNIKVFISWNNLPRSKYRNNDTKEVNVEARFRFWDVRDWQEFNINWYEYCEVQRNITIDWKRYKYSWWNFDQRLKKWDRKEYRFEKDYRDSWVSSDTMNVTYSCWSTWTLSIYSKSQNLSCNYWYRKERKYWKYECVR